MTLSNIIVRNQRTGEEKIYYGLNPLDAAMAAYAESIGDYDAPGYRARYSDKLTVTGIVVSCGDWSASY